MAETQIQRISRKTGRKPTNCKCLDCQSQCRTQVCLGTPEDIQRIKNAGYADRIMATSWAVGVVRGVTDHVILMEQAIYDEKKKSCTFFNNGLCELHDQGLKPTEGRLSHHTIKKDNYDFTKSVTWHVAKTWI